jgi:hypothetical protein
MTHVVYRLLFCLLLSLLLVATLLPAGTTRSVQASQDDCQDCLSTCSNERQLCVENGNPPAACFAAWKDCVDVCRANFCSLQ